MNRDPWVRATTAVRWVCIAAALAVVVVLAVLG